jgi:predicted Ser/Thr protein kinase
MLVRSIAWSCGDAVTASHATGAPRYHLGRMSAPMTEPSPLGTLLADRYEMRALLGRGGMGEVFEAVDRRLGRTVAIKVLRPELAADVRFLARFRREASTAARLAHVGIVSVHDIGEHEGRTFIVMEFVAGRTLGDIGRGEGSPDPQRIARIGAAAARALAHAHERGVVHRDISPANVMIAADGAVKVLDFGIARDDGSASGRLAASRGTLAYLAPEVIHGHPVDARADVYALGAVLHELAGSVADADHGLDEVLDRATAPDPAARFVSASAFASALDELAGPAEPHAVRRQDVAERADRTAPIVRIATRPLSSAAPARPVLDAARGLAVARSRRRRGARRLPHVVGAAAIVGMVVGGVLMLGQAFGTISAPQAAAGVIGPEPVPAPGDLVATASCDGLFSTGVDLAWKGAAPVKGYEIWRGAAGDERSLVARARGVHTESFRDVDLGVDADYTYRVRAFDGPRVSEWSNVAEVATPFLCLT